MLKMTIDSVAFGEKDLDSLNVIVGPDAERLGKYFVTDTSSVPREMEMVVEVEFVCGRAGATAVTGRHRSPCPPGRQLHIMLVVRLVEGLGDGAIVLFGQELALFVNVWKQSTAASQAPQKVEESFVTLEGNPASETVPLMVLHFSTNAAPPAVTTETDPLKTDVVRVEPTKQFMPATETYPATNTPSRTAIALNGCNVSVGV